MNNKKTSIFGSSQHGLTEVFRQRAIDLGNRKTLASKQNHGTPVLVFGMADERYALKLQDLAGVFPFQNCTPVPKSDKMICGIINIRGELHCVVELSALLGLDLSPGDENGYVLILKQTGSGLKVGHLDQILYLQAKDLSGFTMKDNETLVKYARAIFQETIVVLDTSRLLTHPLLVTK